MRSPYGFRSSFRDWSTEIEGVPDDLGEASLDHSSSHETNISADLERLGGAGLQPLNETDDIVPYLYPNRILCH
jgi:hypothetical protein